MSNTTHLMRLSALAAAAALAVGLAACGKSDDGQTAGQKLDTAVAKTEAAANQAGDKVANAAADAKDAVKDAAADAKDAMKDATADAKDAAAKAGADVKAAAADAKADASAAMAKAGDMLDDAGITASVKTDLAKDSELSALAINVDTKDGVVTLNGPAPNEAAKARAETIAKAAKGVKSVDNKLVVKAS